MKIFVVGTLVLCGLAVGGAPDLQAAQKVKSEHEVADTKPVDLDNLALSNHSVVDLFKCMAILQSYSYDAIGEHGEYRTFADEDRLKTLVQKAGNNPQDWLKVPYTPYTGFAVTFRGQEGLLVRYGDRTFFAKTPGIVDPHQQNRTIGTLRIPPGNEPLGITKNMKEEPNSRSAPFHYHPHEGRDNFPMDVSPVEDSNPEMIAVLQKYFDSEVKKYVGPYMFTHLFWRNLSEEQRRKATYADDYTAPFRAESFTARIGAPASVLRRLESCKAAMEPHAVEIAHLIGALTAMKVPWESNYTDAARIAHAQKVLDEIQQEVHTAAKGRDPLDANKLPYGLIRPIDATRH